MKKRNQCTMQKARKEKQMSLKMKKKKKKTKDSILMVIWLKFLEHLDQQTRDLFQNIKEILDQNLPIIYNSWATVKSFISLLGKIINKIPHEIDPISGEITLKCKACLLHCPQNGNITSLPGLSPSDSIKKKKK